MSVCGCFPLLSCLPLLKICLPCLCGSHSHWLAPLACHSPDWIRPASSTSPHVSWDLVPCPLWQSSAGPLHTALVRLQKLALLDASLITAECKSGPCLMMLRVQFASLMTRGHCWLPFNLVSPVSAVTLLTAGLYCRYVAEGVKLCTCQCWTSWGTWCPVLKFAEVSLSWSSTVYVSHFICFCVICRFAKDTVQVDLWSVLQWLERM